MTGKLPSRDKYLSPRASAIIGKLEDRALKDSYDDDEEDEIDIVEPGSEEELKGIKEAALTVRSMYLSVSVLSIIFAILGLLLLNEKLSWLAGIAAGFVAILLYIRNLNASLKAVLNLTQELAVKESRKDAAIRLGLIAIIGILVSALVAGNAPLGVLAELLALKAGLYITPMTMKLLRK